jgi:hypothetical protein
VCGRGKEKGKRIQEVLWISEAGRMQVLVEKTWNKRADYDCVQRGTQLLLTTTTTTTTNICVIETGVKTLASWFFKSYSHSSCLTFKRKKKRL